MAINYKKCPKCGSLNTIKILYGMPTQETFLMAEDGKVKLGGCCVTDMDSEYYCKDCENEWDRQTAIDKAYNDIIGIRASVGGYFAGYYEVDINFKNRKLKWSNSGAIEDEHNEENLYEKINISNNFERNYYEKTLRKKTLDKFIDELKMLNLLNWKSRYIEHGICDGTQWNIEIIRNGRNINKYGDNKFPDEWKDFCRLIAKISGKSFR